MFMADQVFDNATCIRYEHKHVFGDAIASSKIQRARERAKQERNKKKMDEYHSQIING